MAEPAGSQATLGAARTTGGAPSARTAPVPEQTKKAWLQGRRFSGETIQSRAERAVAISSAWIRRIERGLAGFRKKSNFPENPSN